MMSFRKLTACLVLLLFPGAGSFQVCRVGPIGRNDRPTTRDAIHHLRARPNASLVALRDSSNKDQKDATNFSPFNLTLFGMMGFLYWYILVLGAAAKVNGLPVPDFIPMTPGWPATDADFAPVIEDSFHFFYLSELLQNKEAPFVAPPRLFFFNFVEAWIFAYLPALWRDPKRLSRPLLLGSWLILGINLTNAFLAPYLFLTETKPARKPDGDRNDLVAGLFAVVATAVVSYGTLQCATSSTAQEWTSFWKLVQSDRTYLAFVIDPIVLSIFQPLLLGRIRHGQNEIIDFVPFIGLIAWLLRPENDSS